ncbi:allophanate hydrolase [Sphaerisporangium siamense]|uniref:KipI family sensor histidine kinase inhibitor n=1 Tax=Sphaerisporangium siamense TaxID=795645 RepID=A0A7W7G9G8_9ACTN|nr:allophanate hydrolase subunit 1 [Sphaerisporangium siamense]MBB4700524.1 KipI family sensor histidine kinase inhibitor [Sphaerisporangium siamense]GII88313.1 allophanate hydrolase [Sphaerisporangium siamense]
MSPRFRRCGDRAVLVELGGAAEVLALYDTLSADPPPGVTDILPAARTLLVRFEPPAHRGTVEAAVLNARPSRGRSAGTGEVTVPVVYDGADLADVAALTGLSEREVVTAHTGTPWTVAFSGFAPGFAYLIGGHPRLRVPRRSESRVRVPAGAVALAAGFSAVYPRESPGGWRLIGRTELTVWDVHADPPALLRPGMRVRFAEARDG